MAQITTHVLDATAGVPATNVQVTLKTLDGAVLDTGVTDADGRLALGSGLTEPGDYTLTFGTGAYFAAAGSETFYPEVSISFIVDDRDHYHVPLLLSPFGYSTYRGS